MRKEDIEEERESKDKKMNREGKKLCSFLEEQGWSVLNGNYRRDEEEEWTYVGERGNSVIDYVIGDNRTRERIVEFRVKDRIDSDHRPITVGLEIREGEKRRLGGNKGRGRMKRGDWTEKGQEDFKEAFRGVIRYEKGVEEEWEILKKEIKKALKKMGENEGEKKERRWWDKECRKKKEEVKKEMKRWRREGGVGKRYKKIKREYKVLCENIRKRRN